MRMNQDNNRMRRSIGQASASSQSSAQAETGLALNYFHSIRFSRLIS